MEIDPADLKILEALQQDATLTTQEVADRVGLSSNACWRRIRQLEEAGVITKRVALVDPRKVGAGTTVFVSVRAAEHSREWSQQFADAVCGMPEVVEFYRLAGSVDYLIKLRIGGISDYDAVYNRLIDKVRLVDVSAAFAMEEIKNTTCIPLPRASPD